MIAFAALSLGRSRHHSGTGRKMCLLTLRTGEEEASFRTCPNPHMALAQHNTAERMEGVRSILFGGLLSSYTTYDGLIN